MGALPMGPRGHQLLALLRCSRLDAAVLLLSPGRLLHPSAGPGDSLPSSSPVSSRDPEALALPQLMGTVSGELLPPQNPIQGSARQLARGWWHREGSQGPPRRAGFPQNPVSLPPRGCAWQDLGEQLFGPKSLGGAEAVPMLWGSAPASQPSPRCAHQGWGGLRAPSLHHGHRLIVGCGAAGRVETGC